MDKVQNMFGGNAFHTPAGELVEKATSLSLPSEDWGLNIQVSDAINSYHDGAKDAIKAIKKRLSGNKNFMQITLTLSLLEGCVKNCGTRFHLLVTTKEFCCDTLLKVIQLKYNPPEVLQQRVLGLIKQWALAFGSNPEMNGVKQVYDDLRAKGNTFPDVDPLDGIVKNNDKTIQDARLQHAAHHRPRQHNHQSGHSSASLPQVVNPNAEQLSKLRKDLDVVNGNVKVFSDMLTELNPVQCDSSDYELLRELNRTCRAMQKRIVELLEQVASEEITIELLKVNDDLNNIFLRYDRFEKYRSGTESTKKPTDRGASAAANVLAEPATTPAPSLGMVEPPPSYSDTVQPTPEVNDLIDFGADTAPVVKPATDQPLEAFSLSKELGDINLNNRSGTSATPASFPMLSEQLANFDNDVPNEIAQLGASEREVEEWLAVDGKALGLKPQAAQIDQNESATDEFSLFSSERATAAQKPSDVNSSSSVI